jgi:arginyl-tRNA synthetase
MEPVVNILEARITSAMEAVTGLADCTALVKPATDAKFGDYQANGVMALAKKIKTNPRKLAEDVVAKLDVSDICETPEIAGPGFINLRLKTDYLASQLLEINADTSNRLAIDKIDTPKTIVVDFSSPNIAKQMHVGHLRSTIIGDCICRLLEFCGHDVKRQNHIGDWGLQMGMVIYALEEAGWSEDIPNKGSDKPADFDLDTLERYYKKVSGLIEEDPDVSEKVRKRTAELQAGEPLALATWRRAVGITLDECYKLYNTLGVKLTHEHKQGESFYNTMLPDVVKELQKLPETRESDGAICVFPSGFKNKDGDDLPFIIQKSDGAYLYATTDLAALRWRIGALKSQKIIYVTDARQKLHFEMLFAVAQMAKWADGVELSHVMFGSVLGENGKPLKTRTGENVKLKELLDEAVDRARSVVDEKNPDLPDDKKKEIAKAVGIGAIKYTDYSNNRTSDYVFSFDKMLNMEGNTAPYMQYAYARIKSIERKAIEKDVDRDKELKDITKLNLTDPAEIDLAKYLIRYGEAIETAVADYRPNYLTSYLYELAQKFSVFYTNCPVLDAASDKRPTRLLLCDLTAKTIRQGLSGLLGIEVVEQM